MGFLFIPYSYLSWHLRHSVLHAIAIWGGFLFFVWHLFSVGTLARTLFIPWRRMSESRKAGFDPQNIMEILIVNTVMRAVGFLIKSAVIMAGIAVEILVTVIGFFAIILWIFAPVIAFLLIVGGVYMMLF